MSKTILLAGGTGLIGARLQVLLRKNGYTVRLLTRTPKNEGEYAWDPVKNKIDDAAVQGVDAVINLAGAGIADGRWTPERKRLLIDSRVESARVLRDALQRNGIAPEVYISASAQGLYGDTGEELVYEDHAPGKSGFMPECCIAWENAAETVAALGIRTVMLRIGIVLAREGGALAEIIKPLRLGAGGYFADGKAWWSWIHRDDLCEMFLWALENPQAEGAYNAVAPHPVRNIELVKVTAKAMKQPAIFAPAPAFALKLALGEMAVVILNSNRLSAEKIIAAGFHFRYPHLEDALEEIFKVRQVEVQ
jgi:uncharacterized protein (TIGR01777 family)